MITFRSMSKTLICFLLFSFPLSREARSEGEFCGFQCSRASLEQTLQQLGALQSVTPFACAKNPEDPKTVGIAEGARKTMAMIYGTCNVLSLPVRGLLTLKSIPKGAVSYKSYGKRYIHSRTVVMEHHPYLQDRMRSPCNDEKACSSGKYDSENECAKNSCFVMNNPPLYQYAGKANEYSIYVKTKRLGGPSASGIDCSGYISQAMTLAGVRAYPNKNLSSGGIGTSEIWALGASDSSGEAKDCFERVMGESGLKAGDLIVVPRSHVVMVDTVGQDPFGIEGVLSTSHDQIEKTYRAILGEKGLAHSGIKRAEEFSRLQEMSLNDVLDGNSDESVELQQKFLDGVSEIACDQFMLEPEKYKVTILHSSPHGGHVGVQRERLFPGLGKSTALSAMGTAMTLKAKSDCVQALRRKWHSYALEKKSRTAEWLAESFGYSERVKRREEIGNGARILRHDPSREGCKASLPEMPAVPGVQCVTCCSTQVAYEQLVPNEGDNGEDDATPEESQQ